MTKLETNISYEATVLPGLKQKKGDHVAKWEYLYLNSSINDSGEWVPQWINGEELPDWFTGPPMYEVSNQLGEEGWELVSIAVTGSSYRNVYKRHKE